VPLLDKLKESVGAAVTSVSVRAGEGLDSLKLKSRIADLQRKKSDALQELGSIAYTMFARKAWDQERLNERCGAIAGIDIDIQDAEKQLARVHTAADEALGRPRSTAKCDCGAPLPEGVKFCGRCGKRQP
jgi:hypothetical protein